MNRCFLSEYFKNFNFREEKYNNNERDWIRKEKKNNIATTTTDSRL